jgi:serine/threonine protein kinase
MKAASLLEGIVGETVGGRFVLLEKLGEAEDGGVFRTVYQDRKAVIKLIVANDADANLCLQQWEIAKTLSHPHLAQVFEAGHFSRDNIDLMYMVTEYGDELLSHDHEVGAMDDRKTRQFLDPVLDALSYLHGKGIVHGHVKPSNVMRVSGTVKLTGDNFISCGTVQKPLRRVGSYDAPEVLTGKVTPAVDTWSLGMMLTEMVTGSLPEWDRSSNIEPFVSRFLPRPYLDVMLGSLLLDPRQRLRIRDIKHYLCMETSFESGGGSAPESWIAKKPTTAGAGEEAMDITVPTLAEFAETKRKSIPELTPSPSGRWDEDGGVATPMLFSHIFARYSDVDGNESWKPFLLGALILLSFCGFLLWRGGKLNSEWFKQIGSMVTPNRQEAAKQEAPAEIPNAAKSVPPQESAPQAAQSSATAPTAKPDTAGGDDQPVAAPQQSPNASPSTSGGAETDRDADGEVLQRALPTPAKAAVHGMRGPVHVTVRVSVDQNGNVAHADYVSPGKGNYFARISKRAAQLWKFTPPMRKGRAQSSAWTLRFYFTRKSIRATATNVVRHAD